MHPCEHCKIDPHVSGDPREAVIQLRGVWLCQIHYDNAVMIGERLLGPETARSYTASIDALERLRERPNG